MLAFNLKYYTDAEDLDFLMEDIKSDALFRDMENLTKAMCGIIEDFALVSFIPLNIQDTEMALKLVQQVDRGNGYSFSGLEGTEVDILQKMGLPDVDFEYNRISAVQEKYFSDD